MLYRPFLLLGALGLARSLGGKDNDSAFASDAERWPYVVLFAGAGLTGVGSAYYHLAPDNARLVWDRLPMTLAFMAFCSATIAERIDVRAGIRLLLPLLGVGVASVAYWHWTEQRGIGDLRPYGLVQFFPTLAIPLLVVLFPPRYTRSRDIGVVLGLYGAAKVVEALDAPIYAMGHIVSGHTLKHLSAAAAAGWLARMIEKRQQT